MSLLQFEPSKCIRTSSKFSNCTLCQSACAVDAISITEQIPSFIPSECVGCGGCGAACPNGAFSLDDFDTINAIFSFLENQEEILSCKKDVPCLSSFSVEDLLSLVLLLPTKTLQLNKSYCQECPINTPNLSIIEQRVSEANFLLKAMLSDKEIVFDCFEEKETKEQESDRRAFLSKLSIKEAAKIKQKFENEVAATQEELITPSVDVNDIQKIKELKEVPKRRKLLLMALKEHQPSIYHSIAQDEISFCSEKVLDQERCTNCQMCYRICPTQALSTNTKSDTIYFDPYKCIKCESCHDVCEVNAITKRNIFDLKEFWEPQRKILASFEMRRCDECNMPYVFKGDNLLCPRCSIEEEEAMSLWGIDPKDRSF